VNRVIFVALYVSYQSRRMVQFIPRLVRSITCAWSWLAACCFLKNDRITQFSSRDESAFRSDFRAQHQASSTDKKGIMSGSEGSRSPRIFVESKGIRMPNSMPVHAHSHRFEPSQGNNAIAGRSVERHPRYEPTSAGDSDQRQRNESHETAGRRNPLVNAMMQALKGLMSGGVESGGQGSATVQAANDTPAVGVADVATSDSATVPARSTEASRAGKGDLMDAAAGFAHELFKALRGGTAEDGVERQHRGQGPHFGNQRHGHDHGNRGVEGAYSNLAQKLQSLAGKIESAGQPAMSDSPPPAPAAESVAAGAARAAAAVADSVTEPAEDALEPGQETTRIDALTSPAAGVSINIMVQFYGPALQVGAVGGQASPAPSPLLAAFEKLMDRLNPGTADSSPQTGSSSLADKLRQFLLGMASSLLSGPAAAESLRPVAGSLVSVAA
jgi:hypothetical protein